MMSFEIFVRKRFTQINFHRLMDFTYLFSLFPIPIFVFMLKYLYEHTYELFFVVKLSSLEFFKSFLFYVESVIENNNFE